MDANILYNIVVDIIQKYYKPVNFCIKLDDSNLSHYHVDKTELNNLNYTIDFDPDTNKTVYKTIINTTALGLGIKKILLRNLNNNQVKIKCPRHTLYDLKTLRHAIHTYNTLDPNIFLKELTELLIYGGFINNYDAISELRQQLFTKLS
jgi:hypothetical protein